LAVIIGRAGSRGLAGKNSLILAGQPMIGHTIEDALAADSIDRIIVSTDGDEIAFAAEAKGVDVIRRPSELASDTATVDSAVRHAVDASRATHEIIVILYANVPIRPHDLIDRAVEMLTSMRCDSVQSYCDVGKHHPCWMIALDAQGRVKPHVANAIYRRQDLPKLLIPDGGVIAVTRRSLFTVVEGQPHAFLGSDRRGIENPPGAVIDIDSSIDLALAEAMLKPMPMHVCGATP
jgi:N-acylneuraminate cytidylyltransferase